MFTKIQDHSNKLHNILPKSIHSQYDINCIIDINDMLHIVTFDKTFTRQIYFDVIKIKFDEIEIVSCFNGTFTRDRVDYYTFDLLLKNMQNGECVSYDYFEFSRNYYYTVPTKHITFKVGQVTIYGRNCYACKIDDNTTIYLGKREPSTNKFYNINNIPIANVSYNIVRDRDLSLYYHDGTIYKFSMYVHKVESRDTSIHKYSILVDTANNCHIVDPAEENKVFYQLSNNSIILHGNNNVDDTMIVTDNHIVVILQDCTMLQFDLPVDNIYHVGDIKIKNLVWSKELHNKLPNSYKSLIETFMLCNRLMKHLKIPYCVLPIIFGRIIN